MPRATQSREGAILAFFRTQPLDVATVVYKLAGEALKERTQRSSEAKARAAKAPAALAPPLGARLPHAAKPKPAAPAKKKAPAKAKPRPATAEVEGTGPYTEDDLNEN